MQGICLYGGELFSKNFQNSHLLRYHPCTDQGDIVRGGKSQSMLFHAKIYLHWCSLSARNWKSEQIQHFVTASPSGKKLIVHAQLKTFACPMPLQL